MPHFFFTLDYGVDDIHEKWKMGGRFWHLWTKDVLFNRPLILVA
jgi:hypothetical protein